MGDRICPYCGGHLDPDEKCDCREEEEDEDGSNEGAAREKSCR